MKGNNLNYDLQRERQLAIKMAYIKSISVHDEVALAALTE
jgi:hypothetical protein